MENMTKDEIDDLIGDITLRLQTISINGEAFFGETMLLKDELIFLAEKLQELEEQVK